MPEGTSSPVGTVRLIRTPGMYRCTRCRKVSGADRMVRMNGHAMHSGCVIKALKAMEQKNA